ncbi:FHA domain-containing protein [Amycolatopsis sp. NPDC003861]
MSTVLDNAPQAAATAPDGLHPLRGNAVLARYGDLTLVCEAVPGRQHRIGALLDAVAAIAADEADARQLSRRVAGLIDADAEDFPALCAFGPTGNGMAAVVHGGAELIVTVNGRHVHLDGRDAATVLDRVITDRVDAVRAVLGGTDLGTVDDTPAPAPAPAEPASVPAEPASAQDPAPAPAPDPTEPAPAPAPAPAQDPAAASAPVAGQATAPAPVPAPAPTPAQVPAAAPASVAEQATAPALVPAAVAEQATGPASVPAAGPAPVSAQVPAAAPAAVVGQSTAPAPAPAPVPAQAAAPVPIPAQPTNTAQAITIESTTDSRSGGVATVSGVRCARDHFNDPAVSYCSVCGISMAQAPRSPDVGPRPQLGVLVLDDGTTVPLVRDLVLGRMPEFDEAVAAGEADPVTLADPLVSRRHARIALRGWQVVVTDLQSANGTFVLPRGSATWRRLEPGAGAVLEPGSTVAAGMRQLHYFSHRHC